MNIFHENDWTSRNISDQTSPLAILLFSAFTLPLHISSIFELLQKFNSRMEPFRKFNLSTCTRSVIFLG